MIQQQVQELPFQHILIPKLLSKASRTNKIRDWLTLLKAYQQNNLILQKNKTIQIMHHKFVLNEQFWIQELELRTQNIKESDIEILSMGIDDGLYLRFCAKFMGLLVRLLTAPGFRGAYLLAKIQKILAVVKHYKNLYGQLRNYYKTGGNIKKTRELYYRQLRQGFNTHDIIHDQYTQWQPQAQHLQAGKLAYETGKKEWQKHQNEKVDMLNNPDANFDTIQYLKLVEQLDTDVQKLRYLRIMCLGRHQLHTEYFQMLEAVNWGDEEFVDMCYQHVLDIIPDLEMGYLRFLVRRINKHIFESAQPQSYNSSWSQKVQHFRDTISSFLQKPRLTQKIQDYIKQQYMGYWLQIETNLIKDKSSICQLFESYLQIKNSVEVYKMYCEALIKIGAFPDAKNVVKRCCEMYKYQFAAHKLYESFVGVFGGIKEVLEMRNVQGKVRGLVEGAEPVKQDKPERQPKTGDKKDSEEDNGKKRIVLEVNGSSKFNNNRKKTEDKRIKQITHNMEEEISERKNSSQKIENNSHKNNGQKKQKQQKDFTDPQDRKDRKDSKDKQIKQAQPKSRRKTIQVIQQKVQNSSLKKKPFDKKPEPMQQELSPSEEARKKSHLDSGNTLFIKGINSNWREAEIRKLLKNQDKIKQIRLVEKKGSYQSYCYVEMISPEDAQFEVDKNDNKNITIAISKPPAAFSQEQTLFVGGLPSTATVDKVKQLFGKHSQNIQDVRLKLDQNKHIAYIDFKTPQSSQKALKQLSHQPLLIDSKKIFLKQCQSRPQQQRKEQKTILLKHLSFKAKPRDILEYYKDISIEDIYIPENQEGKSKGFAFVQFKKEEDARRALQMGNGEIKGRKFEVQKSERDIQRPKVQPKQTPEVDNNFFNSLFK